MTLLNDRTDRIHLVTNNTEIPSQTEQRPATRALPSHHLPLTLILGTALLFALWEVLAHRFLMALPMGLSHTLSGGIGVLLALTVTGVATHTILDQQRNLLRLARQKEDMTRMLVHDLRDPLMALRVSVDLVRSGLAGSVTPDARETLDVALESANTMTGMVDDLLDIARMEDGDPILARTDADPWTLLYGPVRAIHSYAEAQDVRIAAEVDPETPDIYVDAEKMRRVVTNLLTNAVKVTPPGGVVMLNTEWDELQRRLILSVSDEGPGMSAEEEAILFERPRPDSPRRLRTSSGLGLAFCRMVAEAHGGAITVQSSPTKGATITITVPA